MSSNKDRPNEQLTQVSNRTREPRKITPFNTPTNRIMPLQPITQPIQNPTKKKKKIIFYQILKTGEE